VPTTSNYRTAAECIVLVLLSFVSGTYAERYGLPAPHLFASLVIGLAAALGGLVRVTIPMRVYALAQAVTGAVLGTYFTTKSLAAAGSGLAPLLGVTALTLIISVGGGLLLARTSGLDRPTATLGMIAGGSAGIVAAADDLRADARYVAFMQYLRLVLVVASAPLLVRWVLAPHGTYEALGPKELEATGSSVAAYGWMLVAVAAGWFIAVRLKIPAAALIGPLSLAAAFNVAGLFHGTTPPEVPRETAFSIIGLQVGLTFTLAAVRGIGRLLPQVFAYVLSIVAACGLLAWALSALTKIRLLDAYLATTPGGINAILVTSFAAGANSTLVFAVQTIRLFAMVLIAAPLVAWLLSERITETKVIEAATRDGEA
jgi:membrane AbrB-like protein